MATRVENTTRRGGTWCTWRPRAAAKLGAGGDSEETSSRRQAAAVSLQKSLEEWAASARANRVQWMSPIAMWVF